MSAWRDVADWNGAYQVSSSGEVRKASGSPVGQWKSNAGYMVARLSNPRRVVSVHRLVAKAFAPNPDGKPNVNHINNDRGDNRAVNLEWCTQRENLAHMDAQGRRAKPNLGKRSFSAKLTDDQAEAIRATVRSGASLMAAAKKHGCSKRTAGRIVLGQSYRPLPAPPVATPSPLTMSQAEAEARGLV